MPTALITGASQGLGFEFVRQYDEAGWEIIACCRNPPQANELQDLSRSSSRICVARLDVTDPESLTLLAAEIGPKPVDLLLNNAGMIGPEPLRDNLPRQHFGRLDYAVMEEVFRTNALGPLRLAETFRDQVAASAGKMIVSLSSTVGSIAEGRRRALAYATSKAALNKAMTLVAEELRPLGVTVVLLCPGYVRTRMNLGGAELEATASVRAMRELIATLTLADTGSFRRYNGEVIAW